MVIEYSGNVIRSVLTDKREKLYDSKVRREGEENGEGGEHLLWWVEGESVNFDLSSWTF